MRAEGEDEGGFFRDLKWTRGWLRPAVFTDDFDDGDALNWTLDPDYWWVAGSVFGDGSNWLAGLVYDGNSELAATGVSNWADYEMSADLFFFDFQNYKADEAGIVFHQTSPDDYYYFSVHPNWGGNPFCRAERYQSGSPTVLDQEDLSTTLADPITLRMRRMKQGTADKFVCYAGGTSVTFAYDPAGGENVGLRVKAPLTSHGLAVFDNVTVHGANAYLLDAPSELEAPLVEDGFNHLNLDGTPYMWGLLGEHPTLAKKSAWQVVKDDSAHGLVLKGTASTTSSAEAFRGDRGWINDEGETDWMDYRVQADVKLNSASGEAGVCLRVKNYYYGNVYRGDRFYELRLIADADPGQAGQQPEIQLGARRWVVPPTGLPFWHWYKFGWATLPDPAQWHTVTVVAVSDDTRTTLTCYLGEDPNPSITATDTSQYQYKDGLVGFWVQNDVALFDNIKVLDLRQ